jgi:nucleotide-binding universal stress UspA family protein
MSDEKQTNGSTGANRDPAPDNPTPSEKAVPPRDTADNETPASAEKHQKNGNVKKTDKTAKTKAPRSNPAQLAEDKAKLASLLKTARKKLNERLILVPIDFSPHSEAALLFASELAQEMSASMMVLHVVHDPGEMPGYYSKLVKKKRVDRIQNIAREVFDEFMKQIVDRHADNKALRKAENLMVIGLPVTRILQVAEKVNPFLVVMGSKGRTGLKHLFLGSKAEQVVQLCPSPVTIVKHKKPAE